MAPLTERDLTALRNSRKFTIRVFTPAMLFGMGLFHLVVCIIGLRLSARLADLGGYTFEEVFQQWIAGITLSESYTGSMVKALERLSLSVMHFGMVFFFSILGYATVIQNRRNRRILGFVERNKNRA